jgi:hypothetical protein
MYLRERVGQRSRRRRLLAKRALHQVAGGTPRHAAEDDARLAERRARALEPERLRHRQTELGDTFEQRVLLADRCAGAATGIETQHELRRKRTRLLQRHEHGALGAPAGDLVHRPHDDTGSARMSREVALH